MRGVACSEGSARRRGLYNRLHLRSAMTGCTPAARYSPKYLEEDLYERRLFGVLGSSQGATHLIVDNRKGEEGKSQGHYALALLARGCGQALP
jgi:hypothetical protein